MEVTINGKQESLKFSMWQIERMNELNKQHPDSTIAFPKVALIYSALENSYRHKKEKMPYTLDEIELWADELTTTEEGNNTLVEINKALAESQCFKTLIKAASEAEDAKKKKT